jgi:hypothetical protein
MTNSQRRRKPSGRIGLRNRFLRRRKKTKHMRHYLPLVARNPDMGTRRLQLMEQQPAVDKRMKVKKHRKTFGGEKRRLLGWELHRHIGELDA